MFRLGLNGEVFTCIECGGKKFTATADKNEYCCHGCGNVYYTGLESKSNHCDRRYSSSDEMYRMCDICKHPLLVHPGFNNELTSCIFCQMEGKLEDD